MRYIFLLFAFLFSAAGVAYTLASIFGTNNSPWWYIPVFVGLGWAFSKAGEAVTPKSEEVPKTPIVNNDFNNDLLEAKLALANGEKKKSALLIDKVLKQDYVNPVAWQLLYQLLGNGQEFITFQKDFTSKYYPDKLHTLIKNKVTQTHKPHSGTLKTIILAFVGFLIPAAIRYIFGPSSNDVFLFFIAGSVQFVIAVMLAELPSVRLEQIFRGAVAGLLFVLPSVLLPFLESLIVSMAGGALDYDNYLILSVIGSIVFTISSIMAALAIDFPRFQWSRLLLFAIAGFNFLNYIYYFNVLNVSYFEVIDILWKVVFLSLGYGLAPRNSSAKLSKQNKDSGF